MLNPIYLTDDQNAAIDRLYDYDYTLLYAKMGAGKTVIALTAMSDLLRDKVCSRILVVAPLSVCNSVWVAEHLNWSHLNHLSVALGTGAPKDRHAAFDSSAEIVVTNFENIRWFFAQYGKDHGFDGLLIDELSKLKSPGSQVFKTLRHKIKGFKWRVGMTGTPVSENWQGLYSQCMVVDGGEALSTRKDTFLRKYFYPTDYNEYNWSLKEGSDAQIMERIRPMFHAVEDYRRELPELIETDRYVELPERSREVYDQLRKHSVVEVNPGEKVIAANAAVLVGKLQQIANGFLYFDDDGKRGISLHEEKYKFVMAICAAHAARRQPLIVVYTFRHDLQRISQKLYGVVDFTRLNTQHQLAETVDKWNAGRIPVLLMHPKSAAHGLNLAKGGCDMLFVGPVWSRDLMTQTVARIWRRGQIRQVNVTTVQAIGTVDALIAERVDEKGSHEALLDRHL